MVDEIQVQSIYALFYTQSSHLPNDVVEARAKSSTSDDGCPDLRRVEVDFRPRSCPYNPSDNKSNHTL
jgi:hypothetical protein